MTSESQGPEMLEAFIADVGAPFKILSDNARMETSRAWRTILRKYNIQACTTEPLNQHQNKVERRIQEHKNITNRIMDHTNAPPASWYYAALYAANIANHIAYTSLQWRTLIEKAFGVTPDISALLQFAFYEPVYYYDTDQPFPNSRELFGRFLGLAHNVGDALTYYVLTLSKTVIARRMLRSALDPYHTNYRALSSSTIGESVASSRDSNTNQNTININLESERKTFQSRYIHRV